MLNKSIISYSAYIISYLSIAGYFLAYKYKEGYFYYFNIPDVYMNSIDLIDIIQMVSAIVAFLSFGAYILLNPRKGGGNTWFDRVDKNGIPIVLLLLIANYFDVVLIRSVSLITITLILIYNLVMPLIFCREVKGYNNKIITFFNARDQVDFAKVLEHKIKHQFITFILTIIILTYGFGSFVYLLGHENAKKVEVFDVTEIDGIKHIIFNVGDDQVIAAAVTNKELSKSFSFHFKNEILIRKEKIQGLKIK